MHFRCATVALYFLSARRSTDDLSCSWIKRPTAVRMCQHFAVPSLSSYGFSLNRYSSWRFKGWRLIHRTGVFPRLSPTSPSFPSHSPSSLAPSSPFAFQPPSPTSNLHNPRFPHLPHPQNFPSAAHTFSSAEQLPFLANQILGNEPTNSILSYLASFPIRIPLRSSPPPAKTARAHSVVSTTASLPLSSSCTMSSPSPSLSPMQLPTFEPRISLSSPSHPLHRTLASIFLLVKLTSKAHERKTKQK